MSHLALLTQGQVERATRVVQTVDRHDAEDVEGFGSYSNEGKCEAVSPKEIAITDIARMTREFVKATLLR